MSASVTPSGAERRLLDIAGAAIYLGVRERHLRRLVNERRISFIKERRLLRFDIRDLDAWIDANRCPAPGRDEW